ncbi:MAG TPA: hypothetical protein VKB93_19760 [Thermoanaerobaculia bacterium]|nr:hypothetical protein [Thermoanaerobaculia bacterium]
MKIDPGIYDIGSTSLPMRSYVDVEGSGIGATVVTGLVDGSMLDAGVINGASNAELRLLTITTTGTSTIRSVIGMLNSGVSSLRVYRVRFEVGSTGVAWGIRNGNSSPTIEECELSVSASDTNSTAYGVVFNSEPLTSERAAILRSKIAVSGAANNYGVFMMDAMGVNNIRDSRIDVTGGTNTYGLFSTVGSSWTGVETLAIRNSEISSAGGSSSSYGAWLAGGSSVGLDVTSSKIWGHISTTKYGVYQAGNVAMTFQGSSIVGDTKTIQSTVGNVLIATTALQGGAVTVGGWVGCVGVWDENATFYSNSCP